MNNLTIAIKKFTKKYLSENSQIVFKNRELIMEEDNDGVREHIVYRFKIGDGVTPYNELRYISSLYSLIPNVIFYDSDYKNSVVLELCDSKE